MKRTIFELINDKPLRHHFFILSQLLRLVYSVGSFAIPQTQEMSWIVKFSLVVLYFVFCIHQFEDFYHLKSSLLRHPTFKRHFKETLPIISAIHPYILLWHTGALINRRLNDPCTMSIRQLSVEFLSLSGDFVFIPGVYPFISLLVVLSNLKKHLIRIF